MSNPLSRIDLNVIYLDDIFREKMFDGIEEFKEMWWFPIAEQLEQFTTAPTLRIVIIKSSDDIKINPKYINDNKYSLIQEMIASFNDEATLIVTRDNTIFEPKYNEIQMFPLSIKGNTLTYIYENYVGTYILDNMVSEDNDEDEEVTEK